MMKLKIINITCASIVMTGEKNDNGYTLRYRFDGPPTLTSVKPGISNVQCKFVACLDGD